MGRPTDYWDETVDIVIVGYGFAGAVASIEAHDLGANILLIDKNITPDAKKVLSTTNSVKSKSSFGGTAPEITKKMIKLVIKKYL